MDLTRNCDHKTGFFPSISCLREGEWGEEGISWLAGWLVGRYLGIWIMLFMVLMGWSEINIFAAG